MRLSGREKLIDIMKRYGDKNTDSFPFEGIADKLIACNVIVPPCMVGDTLYIVRSDSLKILEGEVTAIIIRRKFMYGEVFIEEDNRKITICLDYFGEKIFDARKEAEQALLRLEKKGEKL